MLLLCFHRVYNDAIWVLFFLGFVFILQKSSQSARAPLLAAASFLFAFIYVVVLFWAFFFLMCIIRYISAWLDAIFSLVWPSNRPLNHRATKVYKMCTAKQKHKKKITKRFLLTDSYRWVMSNTKYTTDVSGRKSVCWSELCRCSEFLSGLTFQFFQIRLERQSYRPQSVSSELLTFEV